MPAAGTIQFVGVRSADGRPLRPGRGKFATDGAYEAASFETGDGLVPGTYRVVVHCWKVRPSMDGPPEVSYLPKKYQDSTVEDLELNVEPGSSPITFDISLTSD